MIKILTDYIWVIYIALIISIYVGMGIRALHGWHYIVVEKEEHMKPRKPRGEYCYQCDYFAHIRNMPGSGNCHAMEKTVRVDSYGIPCRKFKHDKEGNDENNKLAETL